MCSEGYWKYAEISWAQSGSWFSKTFGFEEYSESARNAQDAMQKVREHMEYDPSSHTLKSNANGRVFRVGEFGIPSQQELRSKLEELQGGNKSTEDLMSLENISGDVRT